MNRKGLKNNKTKTNYWMLLAIVFGVISIVLSAYIVANSLELNTFSLKNNTSKESNNSTLVNLDTDIKSKLLGAYKKSMPDWNITNIEVVNFYLLSNEEFAKLDIDADYGFEVTVRLKPTNEKNVTLSGNAVLDDEGWIRTVNVGTYKNGEVKIIGTGW